MTDRSGLMIDYLELSIPVELPAPIMSGHFVDFDEGGEVVTATVKRKMIEGSYSGKLSLRSPTLSILELKGNPAKFLQGHNLYGTSDPIELAWAALQRIEHFGHFPCSLRDMGLYGPQSLSDAKVLRADITGMFQLPDLAHVLDYIRTASVNGRLAHRGRGVMKGDSTLVFGDATGKSFRRWQLAMYAKGPEVRKPKHLLPPPMASDWSVLDWADRSLRVELRLQGLELERQGLRSLGDWSSERAARLWDEKVSLLAFNDSNAATLQVDHLPMKLRPVYLAWTTGADLRSTYKHRTLYHYRKQLLDLVGVDILVPPPSVPTAHVTPLRRVLEAVPAGRPDWADRIDAVLVSEGAFAFPRAA